MVVCEDIHIEDYDKRRHRVKTMEREDLAVSSFFVFSLLSHRNHRTIKWGPSEQSQNDWSEDNESKSYPELDESALLVAQVKLPRVFEIWPLEHVSVP